MIRLGLRFVDFRAKRCQLDRSARPICLCVEGGGFGFDLADLGAFGLQIGHSLWRFVEGLPSVISDDDDEENEEKQSNKNQVAVTVFDIDGFRQKVTHFSIMYPRQDIFPPNPP